MLFADTPSFGMLIGLPIAFLLLVVCVVVAVIAKRGQQSAYNDFERTDARMFKWGAVVCLVIVLIVTGAAMWPWKHDYHFWVPVNGNVQSISKRFISDGDKGMSQRFVVTIAGKRYGIDDTRAALLTVGDPVSLKCKKEFEWGTPYAAHGWACKWNGTTP